MHQSITDNFFLLRHAKFSSATLLLGVTAFLGGSSWAETNSPTVRPLYSFNQSPLIQIYGLPALGESRVLAPSQENLALRLQIANNFAGESNSSESVSLDGETHRLTLAWSQGLAGGMEWGFELPYLTHNGGFLDHAIERWHDTFGLPQGGRTDLPRNRIDYRYTRNGVNLLGLTHSVSGLGDVRLLAGKQLETDKTFGGQLALRASLKLPTGESDELLGSGSTDLALWLSAATPLSAAWGLYGGGGILLMTEGKVLPEQHRHQVGFGTVGLSWKLSPHFAFNGQLDAHSPFYEDSDLSPLSAFAVQGLVGLNWELSPRRFLEFSVSEDFVANASPDAAFNLSLSLPF